MTVASGNFDDLQLEILTKFTKSNKCTSKTNSNQEEKAWYVTFKFNMFVTYRFLMYWYWLLYSSFKACRQRIHAAKNALDCKQSTAIYIVSLNTRSVSPSVSMTVTCDGTPPYESTTLIYSPRGKTGTRYGRQTLLNHVTYLRIVSMGIPGSEVFCQLRVEQHWRT